MRTTLTLDDHLATRLKNLANSQNLTFKDVVNEAIQKGLDQMTAPAKPRRFKTKARHLGAFIGIDPTKLGKLDDELSDLDRMR